MNRWFMGCLWGAFAVRRWFLSMWPDIEFDFGLDHLNREKVQRLRIKIVATLTILPILTGIIADVFIKSSDSAVSPPSTVTSEPARNSHAGRTGGTDPGTGLTGIGTVDRRPRRQIRPASSSTHARSSSLFSIRCGGPLAADVCVR